MPYVGNIPAESYAAFDVQYFTTSATTSYTLDNAVANELDIHLVINNVIQQPGAGKAYTASGTSLTLSSATAGSDTMYCVYTGKAVQTVNPPNDSVGLAELSATGTPSSSNFLRGDNSWASAGTTINNNADNKVITGSGTANTLEGEANLVFDGSRLGVNNSSMSSYDTNGQDLVVGSHSGSNGITIACGSSGSSNIMFSTGTTGDQTIKGRIRYNESDNHMGFYADGDSEQMRIQSARVGIGISSPDDVRLHVKTPNQQAIRTERTGTGSSAQIDFKNPNGVVGEIVTDGSSTSYATSSDYRLKENAVAISDGITRLKTLKPYRFNFKADKTKTVDGFFAHEVTAVPEAISGTKDAVDEDDKIISQGIDQSKIVPLLTAALKEAITKIETLEARVTTLENA